MPPDSSSSRTGDGPTTGNAGPEGSTPGSRMATDGSGFEAELAELQSDGSLLLVVSKVTDEVHRLMCQKMLGISCGPERRRVVALTGGEAHAAERLPEDASTDPQHLQVVDFGVETRSGAASAGTDETPAGTPWDDVASTAGPRGSSAPGHTVVDGEDISEFGAAIAEAVEAMAVASEELDPQELRVCVDSLDTLVDLYDVETVQRFVHILRGLVKSRQGLAHVHLPVRPDHPDVTRIAPLCDAVVEVRDHGQTPEYRLQIRGGPTSEWLPFDEEE